MSASPEGSIQTADSYSTTQDWLSLTGLELAEAAMMKWRKFRQDMFQSFYYIRGQLTFVEAYGLQGKGYSHDDSWMGASGEQSQLLTIRSNRVRQLARWQLALAVQSKPAFAPIPVDASYTSRASCTLAKKLLNYELDRKGFAKALVEGGENAQYWAEGHILFQWDFKAGKPLAQPDPELPFKTHTGEIRYHVGGLQDVAYDLGARDARHPWMIFRTWERKWDLIASYCTPGPAPQEPQPPPPVVPTGDPEVDAQGAALAGQAQAQFQEQQAQYPAQLQAYVAAGEEMAKLADKIKNIQYKQQDGEVYSWNALEWQRRQYQSNSDIIPVYNLVARQSAAQNAGVMAQFLDDDIMLWEGPLPLGRVPVISILPSRLQGSAFGDSTVQHLAALQRVRNALLSAVASGQLASANPPVVYDPNDLATPANLQNLAAIAVTRRPDGSLPKPEKVDLSPENIEALLKVIEMLEAEMTAITGINQTMQGEPQPNVASGNFGALLSTQVLTYNSDLTSAISDALGEGGNLIIEMYKAFGDETLEAQLAGPGNTFQVVEFKKSQLLPVAAVTVQQGNPASRSPSFQLSMLQTLLQAPGSQIRINDIVSFLVSGNYDSLLDDQNNEELAIQEENEALDQGQFVPAVLTDRHWIHLPKHVLACASPEIRKDPVKMAAHLDHIQQHMNLDMAMPPNVRLMLGGPQMPMMVPPGAPVPMGPDGALPGKGYGAQQPPSDGGATAGQGNTPPGKMPGLPKPAQPAQPPQNAVPQPNA